MKRLVILAGLLLTVGCTPAQPERGDAPGEPTFNREPYDHVLVLLVDKSGSFRDLMKPGGKGLAFANDAVNHYFRDRAGMNDHLIVAQLSGNRQSVIWA